MRKYAGKVIIERGDLVILARRDFEDDKVDVVHKYTHDEASKLARRNMLSASLVKAFNQTEGDAGTSNDYVVFMEDDDGGAYNESGSSDVDVDAI